MVDRTKYKLFSECACDIWYKLGYYMNGISRLRNQKNQRKVNKLLPKHYNPIQVFFWLTDRSPETKI